MSTDAGQALDMTSGSLVSARISVTRALTACAPCAVSLTPAKPSFPRAAAICPIVTPLKYPVKLGATDA